MRCAGIMEYLSANNDFSAQQLNGKIKWIQEKWNFNSFVLLTFFCQAKKTFPFSTQYIIVFHCLPVKSDGFFSLFVFKEEYKYLSGPSR